MLSYTKGRPIAIVDGELINLDTDDHNTDKPRYSDSEESDSESEESCLGLELEANHVEPLLDMEKRDIAYIAGPAGSGKSTFAANLIRKFMKVHPEKQLYVFSRTDAKQDPVLRGLPINQVMIDEDLVKQPIDITQELTEGAIVLFDDVNTIQNDKVKKAVDKLLADILEIGRRLNIWTVITNHLVIPNEKKIARTILNELHSLTVFPKSGSSQQISYALKQYFGLSKSQIDQILQLDSRWVTINKSYPMYVMYEHGIYIL